MEKITFIELQQQKDGTVLVLSNLQKTIETEADQMDVLSTFHSTCALAAISSCECHTIMAVDHLGQVWNNCYQVFRHPQK